MWRRIFLCCILLVFGAQHADSASRAYHYTSWSDNPQPYLYAIQKADSTIYPTPALDGRIRAGIITHHFLANGMMVRYFDMLRAETSPDTIILLGPNHFHHGRGNISLSSLPWKTPFGMMETDPGIIRQIEAVTHLSEDTEAYTGEHSVGVLIPFLKFYFPRSRVVPILVDVNAKEPQLKALHTLLTKYLSNPKLLVLLSMDFSHHSISRVADSRDEQSEQVISTLDIEKVDELHVDCHKGLWLLLSSLRDLGKITVKVNEHTNSSRITNHPNQTDVTSYFAMTFWSDSRQNIPSSVPKFPSN